MEFAVKALDVATWDDFAGLAARHNGVWGGCWCMGFHGRGPSWGVSAEGNRAEKAALVAEGRAHAALVYDAGVCRGWCQFGPVTELPRIKLQKAYQVGLSALPDWRITCFFVDQAARGKGIARAALSGALDLIGQAGGGVVEGYPEVVTGRKVSAAFLYGATVEMFAAAGFVQDRPLGQTHWVMRRVV